MKTGIIGVALTVGLLGASALAQSADDASEKLRVCSLMGQPERLPCLKKLAEEFGAAPTNAETPSAPGLPASNNWIVSETTSPVDYSAVVVATASSSSGPDSAALKLTIQCRGGRTDLVFASPSLTRRGEDYAFFYAVTGGSPVTAPTGTPASETGVAIKGDIVRLLAALPDRGEMIVRIVGPPGSAVEGRYSLDGLKVVRDRLAVPCRWPVAAGAPRNR
jgi:hypothetical protein